MAVSAGAAAARPAERGWLDAPVLAACIVGLVFRFVHLGTAPLWFDETYTVRHMVVPWSEFLGHVLRDNQAPIYYAVLKLWTGIAGMSPASLRVPGVLASAACIPLAAAAGALVGGRRTAQMAAWIAAISPFLVQHAQDARPYALLAAFGAAHLLVLLRFVEGRTPRLDALWVLGAVCVIATHYYGIFFLAGQGAALLVLRPRPLRSWLPAGVIAGLMCGAAVVGAALSAPGQFAGEYTFGPMALPGIVWSLLTGYTLLPTSEALHAIGIRAIFPDLPIALVTLPAAALIIVAGARAMEPRARTAVTVTFATALLVPFAIRTVAGAGIHPRYFAAVFTPLALIVAAGMAAADGRTLRSAAAVTMGAVMMLATALHLHNTSHGREDVIAAGRWLDANVPADEEILITSGEMAVLAQFHWPNRRFRLYPDQKGAISENAIPEVADALPFPGERAIFMFGRAWLTDPTGAFQTTLSQRYPGCGGTEVPGIRILCLRPHQSAVAGR
jgi:mannosyltransferase